MAQNDLPSPSSPNFSQRVRETLMVALGRTGDPLDRSITVRDLLEGGIAKVREGFSLRSGSGGVPLAPSIAQDEPDLTPPQQPFGFVVSAAISHVFIEHDRPVYTQGGGHLRTRVYGSIVEAGDPLPTFDDAVEVGQFTGQVWAMPSNPSTTWRLWIKWETNEGVLSPTPAGGTNGLEATTGQDVALLLDALEGQITESQLFQDLGERIDLVDGGGVGSVNQRLAAEALGLTNEIQEAANQAAQDLLNEATARANADGALQTQINTLSAASSGEFQDLIAALQEEQTARIAGDTAESASRQTLAAQMRGAYTGTDVTDVTTGLFFSERQARAGADGALSSRIDTLVSRAGSNEVAIQQEATARASQTGELFAKYTVKIDTNGYVAGYGLASTANNATPFSDFAIRADKFLIANPAGPGVAPAMPFIVRTTATTINGVNVPVGAYMNDAFIQNGTITNAKIANLAVDNAKIASLSADKINAGFLSADRIDVGSLDAKIAKITQGQIQDLAVNNAKIANGAIDAAKIGDLAITDSQTTLPDISGTTMVGKGARIRPSGNFAFGNAATNIVFNGSTLNLNGFVESSIVAGNTLYPSSNSSGVQLFTFSVLKNATAIVGGHGYVSFQPTSPFIEGWGSVVYVLNFRVKNSAGQVFHTYRFDVSCSSPTNGFAAALTLPVSFSAPLLLEAGSYEIAYDCPVIQVYKESGFVLTTNSRPSFGGRLFVYIANV
jgi:hypothetical protein